MKAVWLTLCLVLAGTGCTSSRMPASFSNLMPNRSISGQWEPEVDYEAQVAKDKKSENDLE